MENNDLIHNSQHGFRALHSTMTALSQLQKEWVSSAEDKSIIGALLWDLSAAFDSVDPELLCQKLTLYGFNNASTEWFRSYLMERKQRVKVDNIQSDLINLGS